MDTDQDGGVWRWINEIRRFKSDDKIINGKTASSTVSREWQLHGRIRIYRLEMRRGTTTQLILKEIAFASKNQFADRWVLLSLQVWRSQNLWAVLI